MDYVNFHRLIISMLSTYTQGFPEFKIVVKDIFDFFEAVLSIHSQRLIKFKMVFKDIFDFFKPFWTWEFFHYGMASL